MQQPPLQVGDLSIVLGEHLDDGTVMSVDLVDDGWQVPAQGSPHQPLGEDDEGANKRPGGIQLQVNARVGGTDRFLPRGAGDEGGIGVDRQWLFQQGQELWRIGPRTSLVCRRRPDLGQDCVQVEVGAALVDRGKFGSRLVGLGHRRIIATADWLATCAAACQPTR